MIKLIHIKFLLIFFAGVMVGITLGQKSYAQSDTSSASSYRLSTTSNNYDDYVTLKLNTGNKNVKFVKIFDLIGNEVASVDIERAGMLAYQIDFSHLKSGLYFCNVYSDKGIIETRKLYRSK